MNDLSDVTDTITAKSDQLNADDLIGNPLTVTIENVTRGNKEQPIIIHIGNDRQPYKPCKSMRRLLVSAWGKSATDWIGKQITLYCDKDVVFGGVAVGGIRISHMSHIDNDLTLMLNKSRGKKTQFNVKKLTSELPIYSDEDFKKNIQKWRDSIESGKADHNRIIASISQKFTLTPEQITKIKELK